MVVVADPGLREVQALLRLDPVGYAERELADRAAAGFPPAVKLLTIEGAPDQVGTALAALDLFDGVQVLGPFDVRAEEPLARVTLRAPLAASGELVGRVRAVLSVRAARKEPPLRVRVDPQALA